MSGTRNFGGESRSKKLFCVIGFLAGISGGFLSSTLSYMIFLNQDRAVQSSVIVDKTDFRQGKGSLRWDFLLQPKQRFYLVSSADSIGAFLHFEVRSAADGRGLDFSRYKGIKLQAKCSSAALQITEVNLFAGSGSQQYTLAHSKAITVGSRWTEYSFQFSDFRLAPWEPPFSRGIPSRQIQIEDMKNVAAFGLDLKTRKETIWGKVWVDYVRLFDEKGNETVLSDGDEDRSFFDGKEFMWISDWREYR
jgi:hypothetical protein